MKKLLLPLSVFLILFLTSCGADVPVEIDDSENIAKLEQMKQDSLLAVVEKAFEDSVNTVLETINVKIYVRTGVLYDTDGFAVEEGYLKEIKDFHSKKEYQITGMDDLEKITVSGNSDKITIICSAGDTEIYNSKEIVLDGKKTFKGSGPNGGNGLGWVYARNRANDFKIKVLYGDERVVFEGVIHPGK